MAQSLGRLGDRAAFEALSHAASRWSGYAKIQAQFALRLIAHRCVLNFHEPDDSPPKLVPVIADDMRDFVWRPSSSFLTQIALRSLAAEPFGIDLTDTAAQMIQCGGAQFVFLLNSLLGSPIDVQVLLGRRTIAGVIARQSRQSGLYDASLLVLTTPTSHSPGHPPGIRVDCYTPKGTRVFAGSGKTTAPGLAFECGAVMRRGAFAARIGGVLASGSIAVTIAQSGRLLRDVSRPEPGPGATWKPPTSE